MPALADYIGHGLCYQNVAALLLIFLWPGAAGVSLCGPPFCRTAPNGSCSPRARTCSPAPVGVWRKLIPAEPKQPAGRSHLKAAYHRHGFFVCIRILVSFRTKPLSQRMRHAAGAPTHDPSAVWISSEALYRDTTKNSGGLARMFREPHTPHCMPFPTLGNGVSEGRRKLATGKFHT